MAETQKTKYLKEPPEASRIHVDSTKKEKADVMECASYLEAPSYYHGKKPKFEKLGKGPSRPFPSIYKPP